MTLLLHTAPGTADLADRLGDLLERPPADPFAQDLVVVSARGMERWLAQRLSHRLGVGERGGDGVCAGVRFLTPASLISMLVGRERDDPWHPDRLVWPVLATIDDSLGEPWCADLSRHLGHGLPEAEAALRRARRYSVARRIAGLFDAYAAQRPALVTDWREGRDTDGAGGDLDADLRWQAELWRRTLARIDAEPPDVRHEATLERLVSGVGVERLDLPDRLSLFGHTRLTGSDVALLAVLGEQRDVHLWLPTVSPALWARLREVGGVVPRADDDSVDLVGHPLLASLGRDTRELARTLHGLDWRPDESAAEAPPTTLLGWLQHDLAGNTAPDADTRARRLLEPGDRSVQVHACHGAARQVEVLREVLVGLLADDPTLEARDILVLCPDIEAYAPLISADFGLGDLGAVGVEALPAADVHPAHRLRVRLADRSPTATNPLLGIAARLVELSGSRATASEVLDLAATPSVRRRFDLIDDDLARAAHWVGESGVRWGLDQASRADFEMHGFAQNTWRAGLDRILLGVAMSGDGYAALGVGLPLDDVGSGEVDLAGRLAAYVDRLARAVGRLRTAETAGEWVAALLDGVRSLTDVEEADAWQRPHLERELRQATRVLSDGSGGSGGSAGAPSDRLRQADVRALLDRRLAGRPTRANFRTGTLTVCTMTPMRSVPHRVVALVGLDDGAFPRVDLLDGDDVLARRPLTGERDLRSEDRQLLLDAVLAATETLVLTYTGANEHTGASRPPAVPLGEVLDALDRTATVAPSDAAGDGDRVRDRVLTRHPLQAHDVRNLLEGALVEQQVFSFDRAALDGARARLGERTTRGALLSAPLPDRAAPLEVSLEDLKAFLVHPARAFLRGRLDVATSLAGDEVEDRIPVALDGLAQWAIGDRVLRAALDGDDPVDVLYAEQLRGTLPPGEIGRRVLREITEQAQHLLDAAAGLREGEPRTVEIDVALGDGLRLTGSVPRVFGHGVVSIGYSRLKPRQRLETWVDLLALTVARPDEPWSGHAIGKAGGRRAAYAESGPLTDERGAHAEEWLAGLVRLRIAGRDRPVPTPVSTAAAWAEARSQQLASRYVRATPEDAAAGEWVTDVNHRLGIEGEDRDAANRLVWGADAPLTRLLEAGLADAAWTIWEPLLTGAEKRTTR